MTATVISNAIVTGANRGLGLEIVKRLLTLDCEVLATVRNEEARQHLLQALPANSAIQIVIMDVTLTEDCQRLVEQAEQAFGRIDCLINNAGIAPDLFLPSPQSSVGIFRQTMEVNLFAAFELIQRVLPLMQQQGFGRIVNMSSEMGSITMKKIGTSVAYSSSKSALNCMTRIIANELAQEYPNILINAAAPGWCKTDMGGEQAPLTAEQGADTPVWLATLPAGGPSGGFFQQREVLPW